MINKRIITIALVPILLLPAFSALAEKPTYIDQCGTTVTEPGNYELTNDLVGCPDNGIHILASDVRLDLNGNTITCESNDKLIGGVVIGTEEGPVTRNVKVRNGSVSNCKDGIALLNVEDATVTKITAYGNIRWNDGEGAGILVAWSSNNTVMHNRLYGNAGDGIFSFESDHNVFKHNVATDHWGGSGIWAIVERGSKFLCNETYRNGSGLALGPESTGNLLRGNIANWNFDGIGAYGYAWTGFYWRDIPSSNVFKKNIARDNYLNDVVESYYDVVTGAYLLHPDNVCQNAWVKNEFNGAFWPAGCFGYPVELVDDDVCAMDDDIEYDE